MSKAFVKNPAELYQSAEFYRRMGVKYELTRAGNSITLSSGGVTEYSYSFIKTSKNDKGLPLNQVSFISKVKRYVLANGLEKKPALYKSESEIKYFHVNPKIKEGAKIKNSFYLDINGAYWRAAQLQGYISDELYLEGLTKDKRIRLAALGSFAKQIETFKYDGKKEKYTGQLRAENPQVFFNCAYMINSLIEKCIDTVKDDYVIAWVDMIVCRSEKGVNTCKKIFEDAGFGYKEKKIKLITRQPGAMYLDQKLFNIPS